MKTIISLLLWIIFLPVQGQTWEELFRQKETQRAYLLQQIASLKTQAHLLQEGFQVASEGLQIIRGITGDERDLHRAFFQSRREVNPALAAEAMVEEAVLLMKSISVCLQAAPTASLSPEQVQFVRQVKSAALFNCLRMVEDLRQAATPGKLEMNDAERLQRLRKLSFEILKQQQFSVRFLQVVQSLNRQRLRHLQDVQSLQKLH